MWPAKEKKKDYKENDIEKGLRKNLGLYTGNVL